MTRLSQQTGLYRVTKTNRAHMRVWLASIEALAVAKGLGLGLELNVGFNAYHRLIACRLQLHR